MPICLKSLSDNTGAESGSNKMWSMTLPLALFLEQLCLLSAALGIEIDVSHIPGKDNSFADHLSRWDQTSHPPDDFQLQDRLRIPLTALWHSRHRPTLVPIDAKIPWKLPI